MADVAAWTKTRQTLYTIARTVLGADNGNVCLGYLPQLTVEGTWLALLESKTYYASIGPAEQNSHAGQIGHGQFNVRVKLWFCFASATAYDFKAVEEVLWSLREALNTVGNYTNCAAPLETRIAGPKLDRRKNPILGRYDLDLVFEG